MYTSQDRRIHHRNVVVGRFGGAEQLHLSETVSPEPPPGHTRVRVLAAGVGLTDVMARDGDYILQRKTPFTPGYELAGEVVDHGSGTGAAAAALPPGTTVAAALTAMGAYAEYVTVPTWLLVPLPDGLDPVAAAGVPLDHLTAVSVLDTHARVEAGDRVLIQGASGGVGSALSRLGRLRGLRMYGTASAPGSADRLAANGVTFIDYRSQDVEATVRAFEPDGLDAVFDHLGGQSLRTGYRLLGRGGVLVSYAFAGRPGHMVADTVRGAARVTLMGLRPGRRTALTMVPKQIRTDHDWYRTNLRRLLELAARGEIDAAPAATFPLADAAHAHAALESRDISGKIVLTTD
ncbi:NADPH:quinone reductase-like Zn-dependent oxidoreductase [Haloactinopolyspora alba]|uniref:NADPH:quinone reductase-like Zn-dependent oxidoreductase n=1 Tax=Haloactinopolyspora alba TaxID=648780 RepID=A0A2P8E0Y2_9ACTN|nr:zinc-binding dehydrogenase [Haloactinopolyspora alba]PSL03134.1 NADPH:quinone reductase-like Zn-dependent oxidoreductase [Haloactinopolyspora alba]